MRDYFIPILLIALILLVPDKVNAPYVYGFDERKNEGDVAFFINDYEVADNVDVVDKDCECGGTGQIKTGDGRTFPCPCGPDCKCKKKAGNSGLEMGSARSQEIPYEAYYVVKLTASWCGPCKQWDKSQKGKLKAVGLEVVEIDIDKNPNVMDDFGVNSVPSFILCKKSNKKAYKDFVRSNVSGETLIEDVKRLHKALNPIPPQTSTMSPRLSVEELDAIVRLSYNRNTPLMKAVMGNNSNVYTHLYNDHGFTKEQVVGLEYWVALALHDAVHPPASITPWRS